MLIQNQDKLVDAYKELDLGVNGFKVVIPNQITISHVWRIEKFRKFFFQRDYYGKKLQSCDFGINHNEEQYSYHLKLETDSIFPSRSRHGDLFSAREFVFIKLEHAIYKNPKLNAFYQISFLDKQGMKYMTQGKDYEFFKYNFLH